MRQARPHLAVAFAVERRRREHRPDRLDDLGIAERRLRSTLRPDDGRDGRRRHRHVYGRARHPQDRTDHRQRIPAARPGTHGASHRRCLFHSSVSPLFSMRYSANSNRIISSPILARANVSSRSSGSLRGSSARACPARGTRASNSRARGPGPGSRATQRRAPRRAGAAGRAPSSAGHSSAREVPASPAPAVHYQEAWAFRRLSRMPGLLGCRHRSPDGVQRNRVRFNGDLPPHKCGTVDLATVDLASIR